MPGLDQVWHAIFTASICAAIWQLFVTGTCVGLYYHHNPRFCSVSELTVMLVFVIVTFAILSFPAFLKCLRAIRFCINATHARFADKVAPILKLWRKWISSFRRRLELLQVSKALGTLLLVIFLAFSSAFAVMVWKFVRPYKLFVWDGEEQHFPETMFGWMPREIAEAPVPAFIKRQMWDSVSSTLLERFAFISPIFVEDLRETFNFSFAEIQAPMKFTVLSGWKSSNLFSSTYRPHTIAILTACVASSVLLWVIMTLISTPRRRDGDDTLATSTKTWSFDMTVYCEESQTSTVVGDVSGLYYLALSKPDINWLSKLSWMESLPVKFSSCLRRAWKSVRVIFDMTSRHALPSIMIPDPSQQGFLVKVKKVLVRPTRNVLQSARASIWRRVENVGCVLSKNIFVCLSRALDKSTLSRTVGSSGKLARLFGNCFDAAPNLVQGILLGIHMSTVLFADRYICPILESWVESVSNSALKYKSKNREELQAVISEDLTIMLRAKNDEDRGGPLMLLGAGIKRETLPARKQRSVRFATNNFGVEFEKDAPPCHLSIAGLHDPFNAAARRSDLRFKYRMPTTIAELREKIAGHDGMDRVKAIDIDYRLNFRHYDVECLSHRFKYFLESLFRLVCGLRVDLLRHQCEEYNLGVVFRTFPTVAPKRSSLGPHQAVVYLEGFAWLRNQLSSDNHANAQLWLNLIFVYAHDLWAKSETEKRLNEDEYKADRWVEDFMEVRNDVGPAFVIRRVRQLGGGTGDLKYDKNSRPTNYHYEVRW